MTALFGCSIGFYTSLTSFPSQPLLLQSLQSNGFQHCQWKYLLFGGECPCPSVKYSTNTPWFPVRTDMTSVKFLYLASRYIGLGYQRYVYTAVLTKQKVIFSSYNSYLIFGPLSRPPISHRWCKTWFGLSIAAGCISASLLDAVLMLRGLISLDL